MKFPLPLKEKIKELEGKVARVKGQE